MSSRTDAAGLIAAADALAEAGRMAEARAVYARACELDPDNADAWLMLGAMDGELGDVDAALTSTGRALAAEPDYAEAHFTHSLLLHRVGRLQEAADSALRAVESDPDYAEAWTALSGLYGQLGRFTEAEASSRRAIALQPGLAEAHVNLANALSGQGKHADAIQSLKEAVRAHPRMAQIFMTLGREHVCLQEWEQAAECFRSALSLGPPTPEALSRLGSALSAGGHLGEAEERYLQALRLDPRADDAKVGLSQVLLRQGRMAEADQLLSRAVSEHPQSSAAHLQLGRLRHEQKRYEEALSEYRAALRLAPDAAEVSFYLGTLYLEMDDPGAAVTSLEEVIRLQPMHAEARLRLACAHQMRGSSDQATAQLRDMLDSEITPRNRHAIAQAAFLLGQLTLFDRGDEGEALHYFEEALRVEPGHKGAKHFSQAVMAGTPPTRADSGYVAELFDAMAGSFNAELTGRLDYQVPQRLSLAIREALSHAAGASKLAVIDLGCGTGLCGVQLRDLAARLVGVDLSPKMIAKARERGGYDDLRVGDLLQTLEAEPGAFDVIAAADVLPYLGDLAPLFAAARKSLTPQGLFAFSVEKAGDDAATYQLGHSGRYAHGLHYLLGLAEQVGLEQVSLQEVVLRKELGRPVDGWMLVLRNPAG